mgnify:CR=1 FL=1
MIDLNEVCVDMLDLNICHRYQRGHCTDRCYRFHVDHYIDAVRRFVYLAYYNHFGFPYSLYQETGTNNWPFTSSPGQHPLPPTPPAPTPHRRDDLQAGYEQTEADQYRYTATHPKAPPPEVLLYTRSAGAVAHTAYRQTQPLPHQTRGSSSTPGVASTDPMPSTSSPSILNESQAGDLLTISPSVTNTTALSIPSPADTNLIDLNNPDEVINQDFLDNLEYERSRRQVPSTRPGLPVPSISERPETAQSTAAEVLQPFSALVTEAPRVPTSASLDTQATIPVPKAKAPSPQATDSAWSNYRGITTVPTSTSPTTALPAYQTLPSPPTPKAGKAPPPNLPEAHPAASYLPCRICNTPTISRCALCQAPVHTCDLDRSSVANHRCARAHIEWHNQLSHLLRQPPRLQANINVDLTTGTTGTFVVEHRQHPLHATALMCEGGGRHFTAFLPHTDPTHQAAAAMIYVATLYPWTPQSLHRAFNSLQTTADTPPWLNNILADIHAQIDYHSQDPASRDASA